MSDRQSFWDGVAAHYVSATAADAAHDPVTPPSATSSEPLRTHQELLMLAEALEAVIGRQGYHSPAVLPLLRALVSDVRRLSAARGQPKGAGPAAAPPPKPANNGTGQATPTPAARPAGKAPAESAPPAAPATAEKATGPVSSGNGMTPPSGLSLSALETRVQAIDQKVAILTRAVGQLVDTLQRRGSYGGHVDRRNTPRIAAGSARMLVNGQSFLVINWSERGFLVRIRDADRVSRRAFAFHFVLELPDETVEFQGQARPIRIEREAMAVEFIQLDETARQKMRSIVERLTGVAAR